MKTISLILPVLLFCLCADYDLLNLGDPENVILSITNVTDSTVTLKWSKCNDEDFSNYKVYYSRNETVDWNDSLVDSLLFNIDTTRTVRKLVPDTRYFFRVIVNTGRGRYSASNEVDTVTGKDTADATEELKLYSPLNITDSSVTLKWSKYNTSFDSYRIFMDTTWNVTFQDSLIKPVYYDTVTTVYGLVKNKTYWFKVYVNKNSDYVDESNSIEVRIQ